MAAALAFARRADAISKIKTNDGTVVLLAKKANECALFIRDYVKTSGFGMPFQTTTLYPVLIILN